MADRRMFAISIVTSDAFFDMSTGARCLYFTLGMYADDQGFVGNPKAIMRLSGATQKDFDELINKRYVLIFDSGVAVIKHWHINNHLRNDRPHKTTYEEELSLLTRDDKDAYTELKKAVDIPTGDTCLPSDSIEEEKGVEGNRDEYKRGKKFTPPSLDDVNAYIKENKLNVQGERFIDYYQSNGWMVGKNKMKDWKAALRNWSRKNTSEKGTGETSYDIDKVKERVKTQEIKYIPRDQRENK